MSTSTRGTVGGTVGGAGRGRGRDDGSIAPMVAVLGLAFLLLAGLVIDSSRQLDSRGRALAYAQEAARAGAEAADPTDRDLALDPDLAAARVAAYCARAAAADASLTGCQLVAVDGNVVTVRTRTQITTTLLGIIGLTSLSAEGDGSARPLVGTDQDNAQ